MSNPPESQPILAPLARMELDLGTNIQMEPVQCDEDVDVGTSADNIAPVVENEVAKKRTRSVAKPQRLLATFNSHEAFSEAWEGMKRGFHRNSKTSSRDSTTIYYICSKKDCEVRRTVVIGLNKVLVFESVEEHVNHDRREDLDAGAAADEMIYFPQAVGESPESNDVIVEVDAGFEPDKFVLGRILSGDVDLDEGTGILMNLFRTQRQEASTSYKVVENVEESPKKRRPIRMDNRLVAEFSSREEFEAAWPALKQGFSLNSSIKSNDNVRRAYYVCSKRGCKVRRTVEYEEDKIRVLETTFGHQHEPEKETGLTEEVKKRVVELYEQKFAPQRIMAILDSDYTSGQLKTKPPEKKRVISDFLYRLHRRKSTPSKRSRLEKSQDSTA
ncbi:unnamed protein product [Bursaphelenchus xylophilus]|uniref:(pine wood nematode) hypothetical protein n=1 Tax=Bursaphelenchus xylophilus TaxID=6326 RepID=A0A1I7SAM4_BURXY|nr:unnamed protein product [Bursaphelenchus xylophilus]CAG9079174.1 unnamed protein product [Bursaphelenchus xylophilus]